MSRYAAQTSVSPEKSRAEIEQTLKRYGADQFMYGYEATRAAIRFRFEGKMVAFVLPLPDPKSDEFIYKAKDRYGSRAKRTELQAIAVCEQATRQRWRALALVIKAKLEAVESGVTTFEDEFLAHLLLPNGETFGDWARPQMEGIYERGIMPPSVLGLPAPPRKDDPGIRVVDARS